MQNKLDMPIFIMSLDVELAWGFILESQNQILKMLMNNTSEAKETIGRLLKIMSIYNIPATWAIVGHLLLDLGEGVRIHQPQMPQYKAGWINWEEYKLVDNNPAYHYKESIEKILATKQTHEIGLHSFFHLPFSRCSSQVAESDIELGINTLLKWKITPKSFIFPGNQIGHLDILRSHGLRIFRGEDVTPYKINSNFVIRTLSAAMAKVIAQPVYPQKGNDIWEIPGSVYFCDPQTPFTLVPRARLGLKRAMLTSRVFHIWMHPWNLLIYKSLEKDLASFLETVANAREKGNLKVMTMGEFADHLDFEKNLSYRGEIE
jgi:peptidoglycan/xylan/chitin deacetylase (PgdA/CDA1 family)